MEKNKRIRKEEAKGITLIALVVTIIILIILATISVNMIFSENGLIATAKEAKQHQLNAVARDETEMSELEKEYANMVADDEEEAPTGTEITLANGTKVKLTKENVYEYLGKKVTNYTGQSSVTIGGKSYTVSPEYRLYYVDFDNKYRDGKGTIYLKAECISNSGYILPTTDTSSDTEPNIKIRTLNPALYAGGVTPPTATNDNMKSVTWLTNINNWASLADTSKSSNINYIVGSPSLEMMMDSYNMHYRLTGDTPDTRKLDANSARVKLFYKYPYDENNYGYGVGPSNDSSRISGYYINTSNYSVKTDTEIDTMYYPQADYGYWMASPSAKDSKRLFALSPYVGGYVFSNYADFNAKYTLCPLVSLKSNAQLQLE